MAAAVEGGEDGAKVRNILVTGGAGFIGSSFVNHILVNYPAYKVGHLPRATCHAAAARYRLAIGRRSFPTQYGNVCTAPSHHAMPNGQRPCRVPS